MTCRRLPRSRSTFNGLAQVIVRTSRQAGSLQLAARAPGLAPATLLLTAAAVTPRPSVE
jgi:beta-galactosidase